ncbi:MAG: pyridoxal-phosphate dependent enzyme [Gemmatimonadota bacterium]
MSSILPEAARTALRAKPTESLGTYPTPIDAMPRFRTILGLAQRILVKRDDAISFGFGGNKVRKLRYVLAAARAAGADALITCGGLQSNHARATAAAAAALGFRCHIVTNAAKPERYTANALLNHLLGATVEYVKGREDRIPGMERAAERLRHEGRTPYIVPLGASTPVGALGYAAAVEEMLDQMEEAPDVIVLASSSGGTLAGLHAGLALNGLSTRIIGISADDPPAAVEASVRGILAGMGELLGIDGAELARDAALEVDDSFVGPGYGLATEASIDAQQAAATTEAVFVDHTYTAKALAALIEYCKDGRIAHDATVLFWHTGGQVGLFA